MPGIRLEEVAKVYTGGVRAVDGVSLEIEDGEPEPVPASLFISKGFSRGAAHDNLVFASFGRRRVVPVRTYMERKGYILQPKFIFIDGRTGTVMHSENFREEVLYNANQSTPALSSYFELMDRLIPSFLSTLSSQKIKGTRVLLQ